MRRRLPALLLCLLLLSPFAARGSGLEATGLGMINQGMGDVLIGFGEGPGALFWQPAGISLAQGWNLGMELRLSHVRAQSQGGLKNDVPFFASGHDLYPQSAQPDDRLEPTRLRDHQSFITTFTPRLYLLASPGWHASKRFLRDISFGVGVTASTGAGGGNDDRITFTHPGVEGAFTLDAHRGASVFSLGIPFVASFELFPRTRVGFGPTLNVGRISSWAFKSLTHESDPNLDYNIVTQAPFDAINLGVEFVLGVLVEPVDGWRIGVTMKTPYTQVGEADVHSYRQGPIQQVVVDGDDASLVGGPPGDAWNTYDIWADNMATVFGDRFDPEAIGSDPERAVFWDARGHVTSRLRIPWRVGFGTSYRWRRWAVAADAYWSQWSASYQFLRYDEEITGVFMNQDITAPGDFLDTWEVGLGGRFTPTPAWSIRLGARYVPTHRRPEGRKRFLFPNYKDAIPAVTIGGASFTSAKPLDQILVATGVGYTWRRHRWDVALQFRYNVPIAEGQDPLEGEISAWSIAAGLGYTITLGQRDEGPSLD